MLLFGIASGLWISLARGTLTWIVGAVVAAIWGWDVACGIRNWTRTSVLRRGLGEIVLSVDRHPARLGETLAIRMTQRVRSSILVQSTTIRVVCDGARIETYGIYDREQKVWSCDYEAEVVAVRDLRLGPGDELTAKAETEILMDQYRSSEFTRWWVIVETSVAGCPQYSSTFPLEVV